MALFKALSIEEFDVCVCVGFSVGRSGREVEVRSDMSYLCGCQ